ncbi:hypothetical protein [Nonomuraea sp. NPDC050643]|uniref:hypothetical protein n=1 Tax=Nonomuraea sp. NPDC050643 TaxID=3155660 RepID=UPI0033C0FEDB
MLLARYSATGRAQVARPRRGVGAGEQPGHLDGRVDGALVHVERGVTRHRRRGVLGRFEIAGLTFRRQLGQTLDPVW